MMSEVYPLQSKDGQLGCAVRPGLARYCIGWAGLTARAVSGLTLVQGPWAGPAQHDTVWAVPGGLTGLRDKRVARQPGSPFSTVAARLA